MNNTQPRKSRFTSKMLVATLGLFLTVMLATGFVWTPKEVQIVADGNNVVVSTLKRKPVQVLEQAGVVLGPLDEYRLSTPKLTNGTVITVHRAVPVNVIYKGQAKTMMTGKPTVGELVAAVKQPEDLVKVEPGENSKIENGMTITIMLLTEQIVEREIVEPFTVINQPDPNMEKGNSQVAEYGKNGTKIAKIKIKLADGQQISEEIISENLITPAVPQIVRVGTRDVIDTSRGTSRFQAVHYMEATAYLPSDGNGQGITATGTRAGYGTVAVDPRVIPLGTRLYIPGYGTALAADTGGAIKGNIIDLCMEDYGEAMRFGRRTVKVYVLAE